MNNAIATAGKPHTIARWAAVVAITALIMLLGYGTATVASYVAGAHLAATHATRIAPTAQPAPVADTTDRTTACLVSVINDAMTNEPEYALDVIAGMAADRCHVAVAVTGDTSSFALTITGPAIVTHAVPLLYGNGVY